MEGSADQLEWEVATRPIPGEEESGDTCFVSRTHQGWLLVAADGLGHGHDAATASRTLLAILRARTETPLVPLLHACHEGLRETRGSAVTMAAIDSTAATLTWLAVGNVEALLCRAGDPAGHVEYVDARGGIVGYRLPELRPATHRLHDGDMLIFATDGIREGFAQQVFAHLDPGRLARQILCHYGRDTDDALVLAARWRAAPGGDGP